jgi:hypothetical protein
LLFVVASAARQTKRVSEATTVFNYLNDSLIRLLRTHKWLYSCAASLCIEQSSKLKADTNLILLTGYIAKGYHELTII